MEHTTPAPTNPLAQLNFDDEEELPTNAQAEPDEAATPPRELPPATGDALPVWALVPKDLKPPRGRQLIFLLIKASLTATPHKGDRQCIVWTLSDGDEKTAADRCQGNQARASAEYPKQMLRAVDGAVADWSKAKGPGSVDQFWQEIGPKGRNLLMRVYSQTHMASDSELTDFFDHCIAVRSTG